MGTHAFIGLKEERITFTYCHFDGYLEGVGVLLHKYYNTLEKVKELLDMGNLSGLESSIEKSHFYKEGYGQKRRGSPNML